MDVEFTTHNFAILDFATGDIDLATLFLPHSVAYSISAIIMIFNMKKSHSFSVCCFFATLCCLFTRAESVVAVYCCRDNFTEIL